MLIFLLNIFIRPDNETKVTRYSICNSRKIYFVWLLNVCAKRKVEKTEQLVRSPWLFMCFHVGKGVLVLSALMILFLTISSFFSSFSLQFGRVKDDERRANAIFFSFSVYVYAVVAEKYRVKNERCRRRRDKSGFVTGINSFFFYVRMYFFTSWWKY